MLLLRYLIAGGLGFLTNILLLVFFAEYVGWWYLISSVLAFCGATVVSFLLQKFWTFQHNDLTNVQGQFVIFVGIALINLSLNTMMMYFFVDILSIWYVLGQVFASGIIAISNIFIYKYLIFKP